MPTSGGVLKTLLAWTRSDSVRGRPSEMFLMSVMFTRTWPGPITVLRPASPNASPGGTTKAAVLNQRAIVGSAITTRARPVTLARSVPFTPRATSPKSPDDARGEGRARLRSTACRSTPSRRSRSRACPRAATCGRARSAARRSQSAARTWRRSKLERPALGREVLVVLRHHHRPAADRGGVVDRLAVGVAEAAAEAVGQCACARAACPRAGSTWPPTTPRGRARRPGCAARAGRGWARAAGRGRSPWVPV